MIFWIGLIIFIISFKLIHSPNDLIWMSSLIYIIVWILFHLCIGIFWIGTATPYGQENLKITYEELEKNKDNEYTRPTIIEWNEGLRMNQKYQHDFWVGFYVPDIYDNYKTIKIEK